MKRRDLAAAACVLVTLAGITGVFGIWWALICAGLLGLGLIVALTFLGLRPTDGA